MKDFTFDAEYREDSAGCSTVDSEGGAVGDDGGCFFRLFLCRFVFAAGF